MCHTLIARSNAGSVAWGMAAKPSFAAGWRTIDGTIVSGSPARTRKTPGATSVTVGASSSTP